MNGRMLLTVMIVAFAVITMRFAHAQILPPPAADYNVDGVINTADYAVWKANYGLFFPQFGDGNMDGLVDEVDYFIWKEEFGFSLDTFPTGLNEKPRIAIDLVRDATSRPLLDSTGNWQFSVSIIPNVDYFELSPFGFGSALAIDLGLEIRDESFSGVNTTISNLSARVSGQVYENDPNWDGQAVDALGLNNPGNVPFGFGDSEGLDAFDNLINAALGTIFFNSDNSGLGHELFTFSAGRPAVDSAFGGLEIAVDILGGYGASNRYYRIAQGFDHFDYPNTFDFFTYHVQAGDVNLDGIVDSTDLGILESSLGNPGKWTDGDLTGEGLVDASDHRLLLAILVPEPQTGFILFMASLPLATVWRSLALHQRD